MLSAKEMLETGAARLTDLFPVEFQVEGVTGTVRGRMPRHVLGKDLVAGGFAPDWTGQIVVARADATAVNWIPAANQRVLVGGALWIVAEVQARTTTFLVRMASPNQ